VKQACGRPLRQPPTALTPHRGHWHRTTKAALVVRVGRAQGVDGAVPLGGGGLVDALRRGADGGAQCGAAVGHPDSPQPTLDRLDALVENTRAAGVDVTTEITGEQLPLAPGVELSAYRIIQEALSNALRHAPGSTVRVELWHFPRGLQVRVVNSRPERPAPPSPGAGHGLLGMRERVAMLGGTLVTSETSCGGFAVAAFLPRNGTAPTDEGSTGEADDDPTDDNSPGLPGEETP